MSFRALLRSRVAWVSAGSLAVVGEAAYLLIGGTLWWWLGLAAVAPLAALMFGALGRARDGWPPVQDGPWGAP